MAQLEHPPLLRLPNELLFHILEELDPVNISSVTQLSQAFHNLTIEYYFDRCYKSWTGRDQETWFEKAFLHAVRRDSLTIVHYLADKTDKINLKGLVKYGAISVGPRGPLIRGNMNTGVNMKKSFLILALAYDSPRVISFLIKLGATFDPDSDDRSELPHLCLVLAMANCCPQVMKNKALIIACIHALPRIAKTLLAKGADPNTKCAGFWGVGPIHAALTEPYIWHWHFCFYRQEAYIHSTLGVLLDYGADADAPFEGGETAAHLAVNMGLATCITLLHLHGAKVHQCNTGGYTPLYVALRHRRESKSAEALLEVSPENNPIVDFNKGATALHVACKHGNDWMADEILWNGAKVNVVDSQGRTPFHEALHGWVSGSRKVETLKVLRWHGAIPDDILDDTIKSLPQFIRRSPLVMAFFKRWVEKRNGVPNRRF
ncbi:hypothetical protein PG985_013547 [Apiospora marii]|uniref:F-box domain-containing protein n=1 Tax=Apiospora marii TaxID=335849 RepID=A0ABR1R7U9_9PEZI